MEKGIGVSSGYGVGQIVKIEEADLNYQEKKVEDAEAEFARFQKAIETFKERTTAMAEKLRQSVGEKEAEILKFENLNG